jgi:hemerythrin-like metal-binding protein
MFLKWSDIYSVNVKEIDNQHQRMFSIINGLYEIKDDISEADLIKLIKELKDYGIYHLGTEEKYFEKFNYPDKEQHALFHEKYKKKIEEFEEKIIRLKEIVVIEELKKFLKDWWLNHIQNEDQKYSDFFNQNGLL